MVGGVGGRDRLAARPGSRDRCAVWLGLGCCRTGSSVCGKRGSHGDSGFHFAVGPGSGDVDRVLRPIIVASGSEEGQNRFRAVGRPARE